MDPLNVWNHYKVLNHFLFGDRGLMAYLKRRSFKRRRGSFGKSRKYGGGRRKMSKKYRRGTRRTGGFLGPTQRGRLERKVRDFAFAGGAALPFYSIGNWQLLSNLDAGPDYTQRIGRQVDWTKVQVRGRINPPGTSTASFLRLMVVVDTQANSTNLGAVFPAVPTGTALLLQTADAAAFNNLDQRDRFQVVVDKCWNVPAAAAAGPETIGFPIYVNLMKSLRVKTTYDSTAAGIGAIKTNAIWFVLIGDGPDGSTAWEFDGFVRLRFVDP